MPSPGEDTGTESVKVENAVVMGLKLEDAAMSRSQQPVHDEEYEEVEEEHMDGATMYKDENLTIQHFDDEGSKNQIHLMDNLMNEGGVSFEGTFDEPMDAEGSDHSSHDNFFNPVSDVQRKTDSNVFAAQELSGQSAKEDGLFEEPDDEDEDADEMGTVEYLQDPSSEEADADTETETDTTHYISAEQVVETTQAEMHTATTVSEVEATKTKAIVTKDGSVLQLKPGMIKKLVEGTKGTLKRPLLPGPSQSKMTKVIIQGGPNSHPFKVVGSGGQPRTITIAQAQQMGLKLQQILPGLNSGTGQKRMLLKKIIAPSGSSLLSTGSVKTPTKILPAPTPVKLGTTVRPTLTTLRGPVSVTNLQSIKGGVSALKAAPNTAVRSVPVSALAAMRQAGVVKTVAGPQKMIIRQGGLGLPLKSSTIISQSSGQVIRIPPQPMHMAGGKQVQYVRLVSTPGGTVPTTTLINTAKTKIVKGPAFKAVPIAPGPGPTVKAVLPKPVPGKKIYIPVSQGVQQICIPNDFGQTITLEEDLDLPKASVIKTMTSLPSASPNSIKETDAQDNSFVVSEGSLIMMTPDRVDEIDEDNDEEAEDDEKTGDEPMDEDQYDKENINSDSRCSTSPGRLLEANGIRLKKPCNCTRSQCLKLYCECFANGEFCFQCNCNNCFNNIHHEEERQKSIRACLERNPTAFRPKIHQGENEEDERRHNKGCNCKRSGCLKNYCECYEAKITCSKHCKCQACRNTEEFLEKSRSGLLELADVAEENFLVEQKGGSPTFNPLKQPYNFMSSEVVEATCQCLLAQAEEAERSGLSVEEGERLVIEEFGRCLVQIIGFSKEEDTGSRS